MCEYSVFLLKLLELNHVRRVFHLDSKVTSAVPKTNIVMK